MTIPVLPQPCASCPYRIDHPSGVWDRSEYDKLRGYDDAAEPVALGAFMCHNGGQSICRGWLSVHSDSVAVRLGIITGRIDPATVRASVRVPLFETGAAAADSGCRDIEKPGRKAKAMARRLMLSSTVRTRR